MGINRELIGLNINYLERQKKTSKNELADFLNKNRNTVGKYRRGEILIPLDVLSGICDFFDVDLNSIVHKELYKGESAESASSEEVKALREEVQRLSAELSKVKDKYIRLLENSKGVDDIVEESKTVKK